MAGMKLALALPDGPLSVTVEGLTRDLARRWLRGAGLCPPGDWSVEPSSCVPTVRVSRELPGTAASAIPVGSAFVSLLNEDAPDTVWLPSGAPDTDGAIALAVVIGRALAERGYLLLHAAAFEVGDRRILAAGSGESGKSTLSAIALIAGGRVISDDTVVVGPRGNRSASILPYRRQVSLRAGSSSLASLVRPPLAKIRDQGDRKVIDLDENPTAHLGAMVPTDIWSVSIGREPSSSAKRLTESQTLGALVLQASWLSAFSRAPLARRRAMDVLAGLVRRKRCRSVSLGSRLLGSPEVELERLLRLTG